MKNIWYLILACVAFACSSVCCGEFHFMTVRNESNDTIYAFLSFEYPDTTLPPSEYESWSMVYPDSEDELMLYYEHSVDAFKDHPVMWLTVYGFREFCMYEEYPDSLRPVIKPLKRYRLTYDLLERYRYKITFPYDY